jgi:hypothetical protein
VLIKLIKLEEEMMEVNDEDLVHSSAMVRGAMILLAINFQATFGWFFVSKHL